MPQIETVLIKIAKMLNASPILWGVGASLLLKQYELVDQASDIDLIVSVSDFELVDKLLSNIGTKHAEKETDTYLTERFGEYTLDGIDIDVMAGLKIRTSDINIFIYEFDSRSVPHHFTIGDTIVPFTTLEDWSVLYQVIPNRQDKANLIKHYLRENGVQYPDLLERISKSFHGLA